MFVLCANDRIRVDGPFPMPPFLLVLMFVGAIQLPIAVYLYWVHPAWSLLYIIDPRRMPDLGLVALILVQCAALPAAWYLGAYLLQAGKQQIIVYVTAGTGVLFVLMGILCAGRLGQYGTYQEFARGTTSALFDVKLGYILIALTLGIGTAASFVGVELMRNARRVRTR